MGVIRHKIWHDLWANKGRTLQVILIITVGAFAIGMIITTRTLVIEGMVNSWRDSSPAMMGLSLWPPADEDTLHALTRIDEIEAVEGFAATTVSWRLNATDTWQPAIATARRDYSNQTFSRLTLEAGDWPRDKGVVVGQGTDAVFGAAIGEVVTFNIDGHERQLTVLGRVNDPMIQPPSFGGVAQFYLTPDAFSDLFGWEGANRLLASASSYDETRISAVVDDISHKLAKQDIDSSGFLPPNGQRTTDPSKHFFQDVVDGIFFVLGLMSVLAVVLGLFLVYNTVNAIISQQVDQIGVMKAIGATSGQIAGIYLLYVLIFGVVALLLSMPLGTLAGWGLTVFLLNSFNASIGSLHFSSTAIAAQVVIALVAPLAVALVPVLSGARMTVREAINTYGLSTNPTLLERALARLKQIPRLIVLTINNTFKHKWRVVLTQITLVLSGLIFMMVMSAGDSTQYTFGELLFSILDSDINLMLEEPERIGRVEAITAAHPDVKAVELWWIGNATSRPSAQPQSDDDPTALLFGVQPETSMYGYQLRLGRWLTPTDTHALVINQELASDLGVGVGDLLTLNLGTRGDSEWEVVGVVFDPLLTNSIHVPREPLLREQNGVGRANSIWVQIDPSNPTTQQRVATELRQSYESMGIDVNPAGVLNGQDTSAEVITTLTNQFQAIIVLLATMAVLIGAVGSISLSGALSLGVIERRREIGVMRAIGASSADVARIFIGEGLLLGWLSWLIAFPLSLPAGRLMTEALSAALGNIEIVYHYTAEGAILWLLIITLLAGLASWIPARHATRISVRDSLAYQ